MLVVIALLLAVGIPIQMNTSQASADQYDDRIRALQQDINKYQAESDRLNKEASTLKSTLAQLATQKAAIQAKIDLNQTTYEKLKKQIVETEQQIKDTQNALGETIADLYIDDQISPLEMLASSSNISEYLDRQEYRNSVRDELTSMIAKIKDLKAQLEQQKTDVEKILKDQKSQRDSLAAKEAEQSNLLASTQGEESKYQALIGDRQAEVAEAKALQAAIRDRLNNTGGYSLVDSGSLGDYPWNSGNCPMLGYLSTGGSNGSGGDGYGYGCRQCASYAAWKIAKETGIYYSWGNAKDFTQNAINAGYTNLGGSNPQPGSIAVMDPAKAGQGYGHVGWVEAVSGDQVLISQYNLDYGQGYGMYSKMWMSVYAFDHYVQIVK